MFLFHDFYPLWAGGKVALSGGNPYDDAQIISELLKQGVAMRDYPGGFHNPPWSVWIFVPFALLPLAVSKFVWLFTTIFFLYASIHKSLGLIKIFNVDPSGVKRRITLAIVLACFFPMIKLILVGQSTWILLIAITGILSCFYEKDYFLMGLYVSLSMLKPQLLLPLYGLLAILSFRIRTPGILAGALIGMFAQMMISALINNRLFIYFLDYIPTFYQQRTLTNQVTLGHLLAGAFSSPQMVSWISIIGLITALVIVLFARRSFEYLFVIALILGVIFSPYAWSHDQLLLLLPYLIVVSDIFSYRPQLMLSVVIIAGMTSALYVSSDIVVREQAMVLWPVVLLAAWIRLFNEGNGRCLSKTLPA